MKGWCVVVLKGKEAKHRYCFEKQNRVFSFTSIVRKKSEGFLILFYYFFENNCARKAVFFLF